MAASTSWSSPVGRHQTQSRGSTFAEAEAATAPPALYVVLPVLLPYLSPASRLALWRTSKAFAKDVWKHAASHHLNLMGIVAAAKKPSGLCALLKPQPAPGPLLSSLIEARRPFFIPLRAPAPAWYHCVKTLTLSCPGNESDYLHVMRYLQLQVDDLLSLAMLPALQHLRLTGYGIVATSAAAGGTAAKVAAKAPCASPATPLRLHALTSLTAEDGCRTLASAVAALDRRRLHTLVADLAPYDLLGQGDAGLPGLRVLDITPIPGSHHDACLTDIQLAPLLRHGSAVREVRVRWLHLRDPRARPDGSRPCIEQLSVACGAGAWEIGLALNAAAHVTVESCLLLEAPYSERGGWGASHAPLLSMEAALATNRVALQAGVRHRYCSRYRSRGVADTVPSFIIDCSGWGPGDSGCGTADHLRRLMRWALGCFVPYQPPEGLSASAPHALVLKHLDLRSGSEETLRTLEALPPSSLFKSLFLYDCLGTPPDASALFHHLPKQFTRLVIARSDVFAQSAVKQMASELLGSNDFKLELTKCGDCRGSFHKIYTRG